MNFSARTCFLHELLSPVDPHVFRAYAKVTVNLMPKWYLYFIRHCRKKNRILAVKYLTAFKLHYVSYLSHTYTQSHIHFVKVFLLKSHPTFPLSSLNLCPTQPRLAVSSFYYEDVVPQAMLILKQLFIINKLN